MYEFEVLLTDGERTFIRGRDEKDARRRNPEIDKKIVTVLFREYVD